jgi:PAS domain S-box-containing protein
LQDITARRDAEEKARASENRYRNLFINSPDAIVVNHQGRVSLVNHACVKLFGAENADALIGKIVFDLFHPDYHAQIAERVHRLQDLGETVPLVEEQIVRLDGSVVDVDVIAAPFVTQSGNDIHIIIRDISQRKKMETALRESHELLAGIAEQAPGVVYQYRLFPDGRSCFPYASQGIMDIYEVTPEEVREDATVVFGRLHPDDRDRITSEILESARTLAFFHSEFRVALPRQGDRWRLSNATPQRTADGGALWYGIIMDITDRKLAEQQITEQLDELRRWRTVMLGREKRNIELKKEVNELQRLAGRPPRYTGIE